MTNPSYQSELLSTALKLAKAGYFVFPLTVSVDDRPGREGKKKLNIPFTSDADGWRGASTRDPQKIKDWFRKPRPGMKGLAIDCGKSNVVAIDLDVSNGKDGYQEWLKLPAQQETPMMVTTRSGGLHRLYRDDSGLIINSSNAVAPGIDIRGAGGLIITSPTKVFGSQSAYSFTGSIVAVSDLPAITDEMTNIITTRQTIDGERKFKSYEGPYRTDVDAALKLLDIRLTRLRNGGDYRSSIFGYAVAVASFEAGKALKDEAVPDTDALFDAIAAKVDEVTPWPSLDGDDEQWIREGITKGVEDPWDIVEKKAEPPIDHGIPLADVISVSPRTLPGNPGKEQALAAPEVVNGLVGRYLYVNNVGWHEWVGDRWSPNPRRPVEDAVKGLIDDAVRESSRHIRAAEGNEQARELKATLLSLEHETPPDHPESCVDCRRKATIERELSQFEEWVGEWRKYREWWRALANGYNFTQVMRWVVKDPGNIFITIDQLDQDPNLLNCPNGTVDLRTGEIRHHDPSDYITKSTGVAYDPKASHKLWDTAREAFAPGIESWLQMKVGEGSFGFPSNDDTMIFNFGAGSNGKSTLSDAVLKCLGDYAIFLHDKAVLASSSDHTAEQMVFRGARWAVLEELPEAQVLRPAQIKKLIGTSKITARMMRQDPVTFDVSHCLMINSNHKPQVLENDRGTWRRLISIPWPYTFKFPGEPMDDEGDRVADVAVKQGLSRDAAVQRAALRWIIEGAVNFTENGGTCGPLPALVEEDTKAWRAESDTFGSFFMENVTFEPSSAIPTRDLLHEYNQFIEGLGKRPVSDTYVTSRLMSVKGASSKVEKGQSRKWDRSRTVVEGKVTQCWKGLRWLTDKDGPSEPETPPDLPF